MSDEKSLINFIPFIYQHSHDSETNRLMIFDTYRNTIVCNQSVNPSPENVKYLYEDEQGYNTFYLSRTSDIFESEERKNWEEGIGPNFKRQMAKYQVFSLYTEKVGRFDCKEILV